MSVEKSMEFPKEWMEEYCHAMADPASKITAKAFAESKGMSEQNLYKWKSRHKEEVQRRIETLRKQYRTDIRSKAWKALSGQLDRGDTTAIKLVFQLLGDLVERSEQRVEHMTPEDKRARVKALLDRVAAKKDLPPDPETQPE